MVAILAIYFAPTWLLALVFRAKGCGWVFATNLIAGWTIIGWLAALWLVFALRLIDRREAAMVREREHMEKIAQRQTQVECWQRERALDRLDEFLERLGSTSAANLGRR